MAIIVLGISAAFVGGLAIGKVVFPPSSNTSTLASTPSTLNVTVDSGFGVSMWNDTVSVNPMNASYNCSMLGSISIKIDREGFNAMHNFLSLHPSNHYNATSIAENVNIQWHTFAMTQEIVSEYFFNPDPDNPGENTSFDGESHLFDYGDYDVAVPAIHVVVHINATINVSIAFTFPSIINFMAAMGNVTGINHADFENTDFIVDNANVMVVKELKWDIDEVQRSLLVVVFNGVTVNLRFMMF